MAWPCSRNRLANSAGVTSSGLSFVVFFPFPLADCFAIADAFGRLPMEASECARVPVLGVFPGVVMALVSSRNFASLALELRFAAVEESITSVESSMTDDMTWAGGGTVKTTELIVTFLRFSEDVRAVEVGVELVLCFPEDRGWSAHSSDSRGGVGDNVLRLDVLNRRDEKSMRVLIGNRRRIYMDTTIPLVERGAIESPSFDNKDPKVLFGVETLS
jgi:hypothetical protein